MLKFDECLIVYKNGAGVFYDGTELRQVFDEKKSLIFIYDKEKLVIVLAAEEIKTVMIGEFGDAKAKKNLASRIAQGEKGQGNSNDD